MLLGDKCCGKKKVEQGKKYRYAKGCNEAFLLFYIGWQEKEYYWSVTFTQRPKEMRRLATWIFKGYKPVCLVWWREKTSVAENVEKVSSNRKWKQNK